MSLTAIQLQQLIDSVVTKNDRRAINGTNLNNVLKQIVSTVDTELMWTVDLIDYNTVTVRAPYNMKINSTTHLDGNPTFTIKVNGFAYTLGDGISAAASIEFSVSDFTLFNAHISKIV